MRTSAGDAMLVRAAIELGHNLGLTVVAEGVEDAETPDASERAGLRHRPGLSPGASHARPAFDEWLDSIQLSTAESSPGA